MTTTMDLQAGQRIMIPATINSYAYTATVESVTPWILSAGPRAGQQSTDGQGRPLFAVRLVDLVTTGAPLRAGAVDELADIDTRLLAANAELVWMTVGPAVEV